MRACRAAAWWARIHAAICVHSSHFVAVVRLPGVRPYHFMPAYRAALPFVMPKPSIKPLCALSSGTRTPARLLLAAAMMPDCKFPSHMCQRDLIPLLTELITLFSREPIHSISRW